MNLDIWHNRGNKISANVSASSLSVFVNVYLRWLIRHTLSSRPSVMKWFKKMIRKIIYDIRWVIRMCDLWYNVLLCVLAVQGAALVTEPRAQVQVQILCYCTFPPHIWTQMSKFSPFCIFGKRLVTLFWMPLRGIMDSVSLHSAWIFLFSHFVAARDALPTQHVAIWRPGNETQQSIVFVVRLGSAGTNPTDSTFKFNSFCFIYINVTWALVSFDQKYPSEGDSLLWYSEYISEPVLYYLYWTQYFYFYQSLFLLLLKERMCGLLHLTSSFAAHYSHKRFFLMRTTCKHHISTTFS